jgi:glycosyltransferase involved in cell wall biosynthesis
MSDTRANESRKRVAVVTSTPLFVEGGHLVMARALVQALRDEGHEAELVLTPQNRFGRQAGAYLAAWLTDVGMGHNNRPVDQVISLRYPSYAVRHPNHVVWLNHTMREYYDQWGAFSAPLTWKGHIKEGTRRQLIHWTDRYLLTKNVRKVFTLSRTVSARLKRWGGIPSEPLYPPPPQRSYRCDGYGDYIFAVSRLAPLKRLSLLVAALATSEAARIRCLIAGEGEEYAALEQTIAARGLSSRVRLIGRVDDKQLIDHLARCRAVCFTPYDEDYGFVTVEAFASAKPVITCTDSGGPAELVVNDVSGKVCDPRAEALAVALRELTEDAQLAERLGRGGLERVSQMTWGSAVRRLLAT